MLNETLETDRAYQKDKRSEYKRGFEACRQAFYEAIREKYIEPSDIGMGVRWAAECMRELKPEEQTQSMPSRRHDEVDIWEKFWKEQDLFRKDAPEDPGKTDAGEAAK